MTSHWDIGMSVGNTGQHSYVSPFFSDSLLSKCDVQSIPGDCGNESRFSYTVSSGEGCGNTENERIPNFFQRFYGGHIRSESMLEAR